MGNAPGTQDFKVHLGMGYSVCSAGIQLLLAGLRNASESRDATEPKMGAFFQRPRGRPESLGRRSFCACSACSAPHGIVYRHVKPNSARSGQSLQTSQRPLPSAEQLLGQPNSPLGPGPWPGSHGRRPVDLAAAAAVAQGYGCCSSIFCSLGVTTEPNSVCLVEPMTSPMISGATPSVASASARA